MDSRTQSDSANFSLLAFTEQALRNVVAMITTMTNSLLEIVNFNVEGEQYVCAGTVSLFPLQSDCAWY